MSEVGTGTEVVAADGYEKYFAEKIWSWIPEIYRQRDFEGIPSDVLRSLVEIIATDAAVARRSIDRIWEDTIIDYADDWAVPYIGAQLGARLPHALNRRARRLAVLRAIANRRRAGTVPLLERLTFDITGWHGVVSEAFRRLGRFRHNLDPKLETGFGETPPGGMLDLRSPRTAELLNGPFDTASHMSDVRCLQGRRGLYNIPKLNVFLFRKHAFELAFPTPFALDDQHFTIDPSGRERPIYKPDTRLFELIDDLETADCVPIEEWRVEGPISCRLLNEATYVPESGDTPAELGSWVGEKIVGTSAYREIFERFAADPTDSDLFADLLESHASSDSPRPNLIPRALSLSIGADPELDRLPFSRILAASLRPWKLGAGVPAEAQALVDPLRGLIELVDPAPPPTLFVERVHYGGLLGIGAGTYERRADLVAGASPLPPGGPVGVAGEEITLASLPSSGAHELVDSRSVLLTAPQRDLVTDLHLQAASGERPYLRIEPDTGSSAFTFVAEPKADPSDVRSLTIDGLWIGITPQGSMTPVPSPTPLPTQLVLEGVWDEVTLRHVSLDPGGERARLVETEGTAVPYVTLVIAGSVDRLCIDRSVIGPIFERANAIDPCSVGLVQIADSIVQSLEPDTAAIEVPLGKVELLRSTVLGDVLANHLSASETIVTGIVRVTDNQSSCFRFSAASRGSEDPTASDFERLPPQFESHVFESGIGPGVFESLRFGDPGFAQLAEGAPVEIARGAEDGGEMGAFHRALVPIKLDDLEAAFREFAPIHVVPQFVIET